MNKQEIIYELESKGFEFKKREGSLDIKYYCKDVGIFKVYIYLSNKVRIFVETSGTKNYYILLQENDFKFADILPSQIISIFEKQVRTCENFNKAFNPRECKYCPNEATVKGYRERNGQTSSEIVCEKCNSLTNKGLEIMNTKPNNKFRAIYNPYTRNLLVSYGSELTEHTFEAQEEWHCVNFNADNTHPNYLHIQLDYDENCQLIFYSRVEGSESLNESLTKSFQSGGKCSKCIKIVHDDNQWNRELIRHISTTPLQYRNFKKSDFETFKSF